MKILTLLIVLGCAAGGAAYLYLSSPQPVDTTRSATVVEQAKPSNDESPTEQEVVQAPVATTPVVESNSTKEQTAQSEPPVEVTSDADVTTVALHTLSDGDFNNLVSDLALDPGLLPKLLDEYRANTDLARAKRMAQVLKSRKDPRITALGQEMVYSGDPQSQQAGFALLAGQQGHDSQALETVVEMIEVEANPEVLRSAMGALSVPGKTQTEQKDRVIKQFVSRSEHDDPMVRRLSLSLMSRWEGDQDMNDHYIAGLTDTDERVRTGALFSLKASNHQSDLAKQALIDVVNDTSAGRLLRLNAVSALKSYNLSQDELSLFKEHVLGSS